MTWLCGSVAALAVVVLMNWIGGPWWVAEPRGTRWRCREGLMVGPPGGAGAAVFAF